MNMLGFFMIASGLPLAYMGHYLRTAPPPEEKGKKKQKPKKDKKGKKKNSQRSDKDKGEKQKPKEGGSLIWGGLGIAVGGLALIIVDLVKK